ncbi:ATP synthase mitochondrial F1 complex assembly factor 2 homolog l(2)k14505 [Brevipalpus obovatus]|uniref:ATP synthase mitochondrial F1 complex assembly factor 2 homolog l(2)k14505 n=1 Tax=Brevipalpus obovatus TaxID=246614 RepID=UPI003D9FA072
MSKICCRHLPNLRCLTVSTITINPKRLYSAAKKRFYKDVSIIESENNGYEICLDGRRLKTPQNRIVQIPSYHLALMISNEWKCQDDTVKSHEMHLTNLVNSAIDNPLNLSSKDLANEALEFLKSDTLCFRLREPPDLYNLQSERWDTIIQWLKNRYQCDVPLTDDVFLAPIPDATLNILLRHLLSYNDWSLFGILSLAECLKSLILTLALLDRHISVETAVSLSRLEIEYQTRIWGNVEWAHTIELMMTQAKVAAAILFVITNSESSSKVYKLR